VADAAHRQCRLDRLDRHHHSLEERVEALRRVATGRPWLGVEVTDRQLVADIAEGYDLVVMGADKWLQLHDVSFYGGSTAARDEALARLPEVAIAPRPPTAIPIDAGAVVLDLPAHLAEVSSTAVREGRQDWDGRTSS
jgi:hypothetical protein